MDQVSLTSDLTSQVLNSATSFLTSFSQNIEGDDDNANVFSNFLSEAQSYNQAAPQPQPTLTQVSSNTSPSVSSPSSSSDPSDVQNSQNLTVNNLKMVDGRRPTVSLSTLKALEAACRRVVAQLQQEAQQKAANKNTSSSDASTQSNGTNGGNSSQSSLTSTGLSKTGTSKASAGSKAADASQQTSANTSSSTTVSTTVSTTGLGDVSQQNLTDVLKALQQLVTFIAKQVENATDGTSESQASQDVGSEGTLNPITSDLQNISNLLLGQSGLGLSASAKTNDISVSSDDASGDGVVSADASANRSADAGSANLAGGSLSELLALTEQVVKKLDALQTDGTLSAATGDTSHSSGTSLAATVLASSGASALTASTFATPVAPTLTTAALNTSLPEVSDTNLKTNLKTLLGSLQLGFTNKAQTTSTANIVAETPSNTADADEASALSGGRTTKSLASDEIITQQEQAQQNEFANLFSAEPSANASSVATAAQIGSFVNSGASSTSSGNSDSSLDFSLNGQSKNTATTNNTNLPSSLEGAATTNQYNFASQLSDVRATTGGTTGLPSAVEQVILQLNRNAKSGNDQMTLQLNPSDMGRVSIKLNIASDGKVQGTVVASNPATLDMLLKDVRGLERALQDAGLRADPGSLQFSLGGQSGNTFAQGGNDQSGNPSSKTVSTSLDIINDLSTLSSDTTETYYLTPGRVNMKV